MSYTIKRTGTSDGGLAILLGLLIGIIAAALAK